MTGVTPRVSLTWSCFRVSQQVFPKLVIPLLLGKIDGLRKITSVTVPLATDSFTNPVHVSQSLDNERKGLPIIAHPSEEEDHFRNKVPFLAHCICLAKYQNVHILRK